MNIVENDKDPKSDHKSHSKTLSTNPIEVYYDIKSLNIDNKNMEDDSKESERSLENEKLKHIAVTQFPVDNADDIVLSNKL